MSDASDSPFGLLIEAESAAEVLALTYTANLGFFEKFLIGRARALEAYTTVVSDAEMVIADPQVVRGAGIQYVDGRAHCPGGSAFHPKLLVVVGNHEARVAIGSGNLTTAGWHGNDEIWTVLRGSRVEAPDTFREIARFLRRLETGPIAVSAEARRGIGRTAELLESFPRSVVGPQLVSSIFGPIVDQLPAIQADELLVYSPFLDREFRALEAMISRFRPKQCTVFLQPGIEANGQALEEWATGNNVAIRWCKESPYRHGKLLEWSVAGQRFALTGSPNISTPALLRRVGEHSAEQSRDGYGNLELGLIDQISETLAPDEVEPPDGGISSLTPPKEREEPREAGAVLLAARVNSAREVELELAAELTFDAEVQIYYSSNEARKVVPALLLEAGARTYKFTSDQIMPAACIRLKGVAGGLSNEVFVADLRRLALRPLRRRIRDQAVLDDLINGNPFERFFDVATELQRALIEQRVEVRKRSPRVGASGNDAGPSGEAQASLPDNAYSLDDYLAACETALDRSVIEFALSLPPIGGFLELPSSQTEGVFTDENTDESATGEPSNADEGQTESLAVRLKLADTSQKRRVKRYCERALALSSEWPALMNALTAKLVIFGVAAGAWPDREDRGQVLMKLASNLSSTEMEPLTPEEQTALASYAISTAAMLRADVEKISIQTEATIRFRSAAALVANVIPLAESAVIETLRNDLPDQWRDSLDPERIQEVENWGSGDSSQELENGVGLLRDEFGIDLIFSNGALEVNSPLASSPERQLIQILAATGTREGTPIIARLENGQRVACAVAEAQMLLVRRNEFGFRGEVYSLNLRSPATIAGGWDTRESLRENMPESICTWMVKQDPPPEAQALLDKTRLLDYLEE